VPMPAFAQVVTGPPTTFQSGAEDPTPTADTTPTFLFSSDDPAALFQCSLDGGGFAGCDSPHTTAALSEGSHQLQVRAVDSAGNQGPAVTRDFTVDSSVPAVTFTGGPEGPTRERRPTFTFTSVPGATFQCKLDAAAVPCASGSFTPAADLADGEHFFEVTATSLVGVSGSGAPRVFTVDTAGPETVIVAAPPAQTTERTPRIEFVSPEANVTFECSVDGGSFVPCSSPWTTPSLALGPHRVEVRALDALGNPDSSPALAEFTVAALPPPPPPPPPAVLNVDAGVKELAGSLVADLDRTARPLARTEMRTILRRGSVTVRGMSALVPGTLTIRASAPARGSTKTVLTGGHTFATPGTAPLVVKPTPAGRTMMTRYATIPVLLRARFITADALSLSASREAQLVRDYLTAAEAKRAVARRLAGLEGARVKSLAVEVMRRCASNCLRVQASWIAKQRRWTAAGRARQVEGRLLARLGAIVSARH
jgi:hypothetical protein